MIKQSRMNERVDDPVRGEVAEEQGGGDHMARLGSGEDDVEALTRRGGADV